MEQLGRPQTGVFNAEIEPALKRLMDLCAQHDINMVAYFDVDRYEPVTNLIRAYHVEKPVTRHMRQFMDLFLDIQKQLTSGPEHFRQSRYTRRKKK